MSGSAGLFKKNKKNLPRRETKGGRSGRWETHKKYGHPYIPPEHSSRGRVAQSIFTYLSSEIYITIYECDCMIVCGDFNARIGNLSDCIIDVDSSIKLISRSSIDKTTNKQDYDLIEFLQEMRKCTLNGIFEHDNFNYIF